MLAEDGCISGHSSISARCPLPAAEQNMSGGYSNTSLALLILFSLLYLVNPTLMCLVKIGNISLTNYISLVQGSPGPSGLPGELGRVGLPVSIWSFLYIVYC